MNSHHNRGGFMRCNESAMAKYKAIEKLRFKIQRRAKKMYVSSRSDQSIENGLIAFWSRSAETWRNIGDAINPFMLQRLTSKNVYHYDDCSVSQRLRAPIISGAGSILERLPRVPVHVWGSGAKNHHDYSHLKSAVFHSVRGPRTQHVLRKSGVNVPDTFGDPVLIITDLIPNAWKEPAKDQSRSESGRLVVGVILHYVDAREDDFFKVQSDDFKFVLINVNWSPERILRAMSSCDRIVSSSLHGLILADALRIKRLWISSVYPLAGGNFKFQDYHESLGLNSVTSINLDGLAEYRFHVDASISPEVSSLQAEIKSSFRAMCLASGINLVI